MEVITLKPGEGRTWTVPDEKPDDYRVPDELVPECAVSEDGMYTLSIVLVCRPAEVAPLTLSVCGVTRVVDTQVYGSCQTLHLTPADVLSVRIVDAEEGARPVFYCVSLLLSELVLPELVPPESAGEMSALDGGGEQTSGA